VESRLGSSRPNHTCSVPGKPMNYWTFRCGTAVALSAGMYVEERASCITPTTDGRPYALSVELIRRDLQTSVVGFQIDLYADIDSTNAALRRLAEVGARAGTVVLAETQRAARGRDGTPWFSPPECNLYASVLLRPWLGPRAVQVFSFITSLALSDAVRAEGVPAAIKWPNDILIEGRKVAGSFGVVATAGDLVDYVILGVGVNVNVERRTLERGLGAAAAGAISLREATGRLIDRNRFTAGYLNTLEHWLDVYRVFGPSPVLEAWRKRDLLAGRWVRVRGEGPQYEGRVLGANSDGQLVVQDPWDVQHRVVAAEVTVLD
jgi:BirA family biotin operon repressor/biotin-[acetyl-CoA-carboxylase] ligase